jgi:hypothetical protein
LTTEKSPPQPIFLSFHFSVITPELSAFFEEWSQAVAESIQVDTRGALVLCSPKWFA